MSTNIGFDKIPVICDTEAHVQTDRFRQIIAQVFGWAGREGGQLQGREPKFGTIEQGGVLGNSACPIALNILFFCDNPVMTLV